VCKIELGLAALADGLLFLTDDPTLVTALTLAHDLTAGDVHARKRRWYAWM
jgi:hypothetical protein